MNHNLRHYILRVSELFSVLQKYTKPLQAIGAICWAVRDIIFWISDAHISL